MQKKNYIGIGLAVLLVIGTFLVGVEIGRFMEPHDLIVNEGLARLGEAVYKIYVNGDKESKIVALKAYKKYILELNKMGVEDITGSFETDLGLTFARLGCIYEQTGQSSLAEQNFDRAFQLLRNEFSLATKNEVKSIINKLDGIKCK